MIYEVKQKKVLYVRMLKALYGMMITAILYYKKFRKDIKSIGFEVNPFDICVANRMVNGKQHAVTWHMDDVKTSHDDPKVCLCHVSCICANIHFWVCVCVCVCSCVRRVSCLKDSN